MQWGLTLLWHSVITEHYCDIVTWPGVITGEWPTTGEFMANLNETLSGLGTHITSASSNNIMFIHQAVAKFTMMFIRWVSPEILLLWSSSGDHHPGDRHPGTWGPVAPALAPASVGPGSGDWILPTVRTQTSASDEAQVQTRRQTTWKLIAVITLSDGGAVLTPGVTNKHWQTDSGASDKLQTSQVTQQARGEKLLNFTTFSIL